MGILSKLFGNRKEAILEALENGAKVIDVRTVSEFKTGSVDGTINLPFDQLNDKSIKRIKKLKVPIILCCASGSRSAAAKGRLLDAGIEAHNGGSWYKVHRLMVS
ncbi:MAG: rhodanese-like domain-containing protein [Prolixibacteraceae bacterium]|jgi:phage shock protein E|nr:rhodanese-like domain-containing protein [Prolixibacteraceae bacterium]